MRNIIVRKRLLHEPDMHNDLKAKRPDELIGKSYFILFGANSRPDIYRMIC